VPKGVQAGVVFAFGADAEADDEWGESGLEFKGTDVIVGVVFEHEPGDHAEADAEADERGNGFVAGDGACDMGFGTMVLEPGDGAFADGATGGEDKRDGLPWAGLLFEQGPQMGGRLGWSDPIEACGGHGMGEEAGRQGGGEGRDGGIDLAVDQAGECFGGVACGDGDPDAGVCLEKVGKEARQDAVAGGNGAEEAEGAREPGVGGANAVLNALPGGERFAGILLEEPTGVGEGDLFAVAMKEGGTDCGFEALDQPGEGGGGEVGALAGFVEV